MYKLPGIICQIISLFPFVFFLFRFLVVASTTTIVKADDGMLGGGKFLPLYGFIG